MPKYKIVCFLLAAVLAAVGTVLVIRNLGGGEIPTFEKPSEDLNTYLDKTDDIDIDDVNADTRQFLFVAHKLLLESKGFYGVADGTSTAVGVKQYVRNTRYVVGDFGNKNTFKEMVTKGVVGKAYQLYMWENNYVYRKGNKINSIDDVVWASSAQALSEAAFYSDFGHRNDKLTGYILNWDTVTGGELVDKANGVYTFRYVLDAETAPMYLRREMIFNGGLNSEPSFNRCVIYVAMDADFNVKTLRTDCEYKAQTMGINATCVEDITEVFTPYEGDLPNKDFFEQYFTENPDDGIVNEQTALDVLMEMFSPYLNGQDLQVAIAARNNGDIVVDGLVSIEGLDIADLSKLAVNLKIGNLDLAYVHGDGAIYLKYKDFQGSTTVSGIVELVYVLAPLFGDGTTSVALGDFDIASLLDNLTYSVADGKVVVSLPVSLGDLTIDAKLYGDVDGETYTFTSAIITIGDVEINITPCAWTVAERTGAYPEILGLVDLLQNGKIALNAQLTLGKYAVNADVLVELATGNMDITAELGNNGTVNVTYVDGVAYVAFGEVKLKLDTANIDELLELVYKYTGLNLATATPSMTISAQSILALLGSISTTQVEGGVDFNLSVMGIDASLRLANNNGRWNLHSITAVAEGISAVIVGAEVLSDVSVPSDSEAYADITELVETFAEPLLDIVRGNVYGANFNATLAIGGKQYDVVGKVSVDLNKTLKLNATIYDGKLGVIDAEVIYANDTVFLSVNGVKVAFAVNGSSDVDVIAKVSELLNNAQIKEILDSRAELAQLVEQATTLIGVATNFTLADLLDVDFTSVVTSFRFEKGVLSLSVNGKALGVDGLALDITLANCNGCLAVGIGGLSVAGVGLDVSAVVLNTAEQIVIPNTNEYMLSLAGELMGAELQLTLDLVHMDIWASVKYSKELMLVRYLNGKVYIQYGGAKVVFNTSELDTVASKLGKLVTGLPATDSLDITKVLAVLSAIQSDLTGETPNVSVDVSGVRASINFTNVDNKLVFDNVSVRFELGGKAQVATISAQTKRAEQLDVSGEFVDGNALVESIVDTVAAFRNINAVSASLSLDLTVNGARYSADVTFNLNGGLYLNAILKHNGKAVVSAEIYLVDGTLYFDVNGIRQAVVLPDSNSSDIDIAAILGAIGMLDGINGELDSLVQYAKQLPDYLDGIVFSQIIDSLTFANGELTLKLDLAQLGLGEVALKLGLGSTLTVDASGRVANVNYNASAAVRSSSEQVVAPKLDSYVTELKLNVGNEISAIVKLDLYHNTVVGTAVAYGQTVNFKYANGVVYLTYGNRSNVGFKLDLDDIDVLLEAISHFVELPQMSFDGNGNIAETLMGIWDNITLARRNTSDGYTLEVTYGSVAVAVNFTATENSVALAAVQVNAGELSLTAEQVHDEKYPVLPSGGYVDIAKLAGSFAEPVAEIVGASGYNIGIDGSIALNGRVYSFKATLKLNNNVYVEFELSYEGTQMIAGELWVVDNVLYLQSGDIRFALSLGDNTDKGETTLDSIKETLSKAQGYNSYVDQIVELVLNVLNTPASEVNFEQLLSSLTYNNGNVTLGVNGQQFGLNSFTLALANANGLSISVNGLNYNGIALNINNANIFAFDGEITAPDGNFSTNIVVDVKVDNNANTSGEHNVIYANLDLLNGVILIRIETTMPNGTVTYLDAKYTVSDNVLKLTNGKHLNVLVQINNIASIVNRINDIVNEYAGAGDQALPDLFGSLGGDIDLKAIVKSLFISRSDGNVLVGAKALGFDITASFNRGLNSITVPVDMLQSDFVVSFSSICHEYTKFSDKDSDYVSVDQVFDDFYYGEGGEGPIYNLVHTNSWMFSFNKDSEITVKNDDGTTTKYQILSGSYVAFYYNKTAPQNSKVRAKLTVQKDGNEFLYLDVAFIDGRIYATYDSNKSNNNKNELKATVSLDAIKETIDLLPALIKVVPQIGTVIDDVKSAMANAQGKMTLGNVSQIIESVSYVDRKFTLQINGSAIDSNKFDSEPITLKVSEYGNEGLSLDQLTLGYGNVSVNLVEVVVTGSNKIDGTDEFEYVRDYIESYFQERGDINSHMNFDSIRELLSAFIITADNTDENGYRSFALEGKINATLVGNKAIIGITIHVDIDSDNNVYIAVKLSRDASGILSGMIYADDGGYSYMLLNTKDSTVSLYRDSYSDYTYCSRCGNWTCSNSILHAAWRKKQSFLDTQAPVGNQLPSFMIENMKLSEFTADTSTMVGYILDTINLGNMIDSQIRKAIGKENTNVYGIEDIFKSYTYSYVEATEIGTFALKADLSPIDSALGVITANIIHTGNFDNVGYDDEGNFNDGNVKLTQIKGTAEMIEIMNATYELNLMTPTSGTAYNYVTNNIYVW